MKYRKIQTEVFKILQNGNRVHRHQISENEIAITDGIKMFVLPTSIINFNIEKCHQNDEIAKCFEDKGILSKLRITDDLKILKPNKGFARKFTCENFDLWLNNSWLDYFDNAKFWATGPLEPVKVYEKICRKDILVGVLMPIRMSNKEDVKYEKI